MNVPVTLVKMEARAPMESTDSPVLAAANGPAHYVRHRSKVWKVDKTKRQAGVHGNSNKAVLMDMDITIVDRE